MVSLKLKKKGGCQVEELDYMDFGGLKGYEILNGVNVWKSCENQKDPKLTLCTNMQLIHFTSRSNICLAILVCVPRVTRVLQSHGISVSHNF